jgi:hypothetical protein
MQAITMRAMGVRTTHDSIPSIALAIRRVMHDALPALLPFVRCHFTRDDQ